MNTNLSDQPRPGQSISVPVELPTALQPGQYRWRLPGTGDISSNSVAVAWR